MRGFKRLWRKLAFLGNRRQFERDLEEEMRLHREMAGARQFGNTTLMKEISREMWGFTALETALQDLRYAFRALRRSPAFTIVAALSLALGIGVNTAVFSLVHAVLLRDLPYPDSGRIVYLNRSIGGGNAFTIPDMSVPELQFFKENSRAFTAVAGYRDVSERDLRAGDQQQLARVIRVTTDFFRTLGVLPLYGREFTTAEALPGGPPAIVIGSELARRLFGSETRALGRAITLGSENCTVVGVLPGAFWFPQSPNAFVPLRAGSSLADSGANTSVLARIRPDLSLQQAQAEMPSIFERYRRAHRDLVVKGEDGITLETFHHALSGDVRLKLWLLFAASALLLLIACSNVGSLLLARLTARQKEIAIRMALGGGRVRLLRQFLVENIALSLTGGIAGVLAAYLVLGVFVAMVPFDLPSSTPIRIDAAVLLFAFAVANATGALFSLTPLVRSRRDEVNADLNAGGRGDAVGSARSRLRSVLVVGQVALSVALLVSSGLFIKTLYELNHQRLGFDPEGVVTFETPFAAATSIVSYEQTLREHLRATPGVREAGAINVLPLTGHSNIPAERAGHPEQSIGGMEYRIVTPGYFAAMEMPVLQGRGISADDRKTSAPVVVINETLARTWWPNGNALGGQVAVGRYENRVFPEILEPVRTVVGVVPDTKTMGLKEAEVRPILYVPATQVSDNMTPDGMVWALRSGRLGGTEAEIRRAIAEVNPAQRIVRMRSMTEVMASTTLDNRFYAWLIASFAGVALVLTMIGIYGLLAFTVARRTHEIGTRMALGARQVDILKLVLRQGLVLCAAGLAVGLGGALAFTRVLKSLLFGVAPTDPLSFIAVAVLLLAVAVLASYIPARRATKVDPLVALRYE